MFQNKGYCACFSVKSPFFLYGRQPSAKRLVEINRYIKIIVVKQINELLDEKYKPDIFWFDGHWKIKSKYAKNKIHELLLKIKKEGIIINDRVPEDSLNLVDFKNVTDRYIPEEKIENWEHVNTIGYSWGYNKEQTEKDYKTKEELKNLYNKVTELGGKFLLNLGPNKDGEICEFENEKLDFLN